MTGKADINRIEGDEFLSSYPVGTYRLLFDKIGYVFSYIKISSFRSKISQIIKVSSGLLKNCKQNLLTFYFIIPTFFVVGVFTF